MYIIKRNDGKLVAMHKYGEQDLYWTTQRCRAWELVSKRAAKWIKLLMDEKNCRILKV